MLLCGVLLCVDEFKGSLDLTLPLHLVNCEGRILDVRFAQFRDSDFDRVILHGHHRFVAFDV